MPTKYLDFDLEIGIGQGREYPVVVRSPAGEARATMTFPFDYLALENRLLILQNVLLRLSGKRRLAPSQDELTVRDFGKALFDAALVEDVRSLFYESRRMASQQDAGLRIRLRVASPSLAALPWEFLYDARHGHICLSINTPVVRYLELPQPPQPLTIAPPLRILGMIVSPGDQQELDLERERTRLEKAIEPLRAKGLVEVTWLEGHTWRDLQRAMHRGPWHVFHFAGHGAFDVDADEGMVVLADDRGRAHPFRATELGRLLADHRPMRLVVLNACEGGRGSERDIFSSTASILVRAGLPAVLAMQYEITDRAAIELTRAFYEALADELPVDAALAEARKAVSLAVSNSFEWGIPVLYMRSPDGVLFELGTTPSPVHPAPKQETPQPPAYPVIANAKTPRVVPKPITGEVHTIKQPLHMEFVRVPAGTFLMGSDPTKDRHALHKEEPQHTLYLDEFHIGKHPVTNFQYGEFVRVTQRPAPSHWRDGIIPLGKLEHPVVNVSWYDAVAFCRWLEEATGKPFRLPSEAEWEKTASWDDKTGQKHTWPWGNVCDTNKCNSQEGKKSSTTTVGAYSPAGDSPYGAADMSGNVWEWCSTKWRIDYSTPQDDSLDDFTRRVVRGGSFCYLAKSVRCAVRDSNFADVHHWHLGFRVAVALR